MGFTNNDILLLAKAGFTAEQIAALNQVAPAPAPAPTPAPVPAAPAPAPAPAPVEVPTNTGTNINVDLAARANQQGATIDDVLGAISGLTQTFQNGFLQNAEQPAKPVTAESILAEIINPPQKPIK